MARHPIPHRRKVLFIAIGAVSLVVIGGMIAFVVLLSGAYSTAATKQHFNITYQILELGLHFSVKAYADQIAVPKLDDPAQLQVGTACYRQYCVQCHGAPGVARDDLGKGMLPAPSSLSQSGREWPASHLYYVTKKGVRMAGMPAWEFRMSEDALWSTVAFLRAMPVMDAQRYETLAQSSADVQCPPAVQPTEYTTERAQTTLRQYACENCHIIEDLVGPTTYVGPPLHDWHKRKLIAGVLPNTKENLTRWIMDPQTISPHTLMPDLEVEEAHARHMTEYLFGRRQK